MGKPEPLVTDEQYFAIRSKIKDGDVLLSKENYRLTSLFIPGKWKHAAIYSEGYVYEAVKEGVRKITIERFVFSKDQIGLITPKFKFHAFLLKAFLDHQLGKEYDYDFNTSSQASFYCSELCYAGLKSAYVSEDGKELGIVPMERLGHSTVTPEDLYLLATQSSKGLFEVKVEFWN